MLHWGYSDEQIQFLPLKELNIGLGRGSLGLQSLPATTL